MICDEFKKTSKKVRNWIDAQPEVKEESITDWMLYRLSEKLPMFKYKQFTRKEENAITGADWEWWILTPNGSFGARIQAKRLRGHSNNLKALTYTRGPKSQLDTLLDNARDVGLPAFYAFYSGNRHVSKCSQLYSDGGIHLVAAKTIESEIDMPASYVKISDSDIIGWGVPLSCLFCCPMNNYKGVGLLEQLRRFLYVYFPVFGEGNDNIGFKREPPDYITSLVSESEQERLVSSSDSNIAGQVAGIVVIDLRIYLTLYG